MDNTEREAPAPAETGATDRMLLLIVGALLVCIIATLAVLWQRERSARVDAEDRLAQRPAVNPAQMMMAQQMLQGQLAGDDRELVEPIQQREVMEKTSVDFQSRPRPLIRITAQAGQRFGFDPGDLVIIAVTSATQPATTQASR